MDVQLHKRTLQCSVCVYIRKHKHHKKQKLASILSVTRLCTLCIWLIWDERILLMEVTQSHDSPRLGVIRSGWSRKMSRLDLFSLQIMQPLFTQVKCALADVCVFTYTQHAWLQTVSMWEWNDPKHGKINVFPLQCSCLYSGNRSSCVRAPAAITHTAVIFSTGGPAQCG